MNRQARPAVSFLELALVVAGAAYAAGASPPAARRTTWDTTTLAVTAWIGA